MVTFKDCNLQDLRRNEVLQLIGITLSYMQLVQNKDMCSHSWIYIFLVYVWDTYTYTHRSPCVGSHLWQTISLYKFLSPYLSVS